MPVHAKSAYFYNQLLEKLGTGNKYEEISSGDKVRFMYVETPNKYGLQSIGFKYEYPEEFEEIFKIDYEKMFDKILYQSIARFMITLIGIFVSRRKMFKPSSLIYLHKLQYK